MSKREASPIVVIGAGLAGLAASLSLARAGRPVLLVEATDAVGGCCSTTLVSGFTFNNGALYVAVPSLLRAAFERLGLDFDAEAPLVRIERPQETRLQDGTVVRLSDVENSSVEGPKANEKTAILRDGLGGLQRRWAPVYRTLIDEVLPFEPSLLRTLSRLWRYLPRMGGHVDALIKAHFPEPALQAAVASTLLYTGTSPDRLPATQIIGLLALLEEGFHLPRGGMGAISAALHRALQRHSVPIRCGQRVDRIEVADGAVCGVVLAGGERIAAQCVVATCSGFALVDHLLPRDALPSRLAGKARKAPRSHRAVAIQFGCSGAELPGAFVVNHVPAMQQQGRMHVSTPGTPQWLSYATPTCVLPELAPPGKAVIELYAPATGVASASEWTPDMTARAVGNHFTALKARHPTLAIEATRVLDPQDFARSRHLYDGALYGIAPGATPDKFFPHRTPLRGLYLAGQTTFPGYGVPSAILSGIQAADALARDAG
ncbi:phytoene desaturase family protein [Luteimonas sp. R10]|uniref:phytoene desaturase family protein n=1 Tax=Luteimonas sp. R10 TaxID=3108176 RepID=UPI0030890626|nr:NAD(P)/FAD-dependent oxidoreductase [Luteimonas sp. R10]